MKLPTQDGSSYKGSTRRSFLKNTGTLGAVLSGTLSVAGASAIEGNTTSSSELASCEYSLLPKNFIYLNSGTEGSMPDCVIATFREGLQKWASNPTTSYETDPVFGKHQALNREFTGHFFGVEKDNICLTDNTTMGMSMTLMGLNFKPGDKAIITNHEHNAIKSPLEVQREKVGLEIITRSFPPASRLHNMNTGELLDALFPNIVALRGAKALCVSHVYPTTGVRLPLEALRNKCDELNIEYLVVDGAQALGMVDLGPGRDHIAHSDFYAGPGHKWLNGPPSTGVLYLKNAAIRPPQFYPMLSQRMSKYDNANSTFPMAEALQVRGCCNIPGFVAMIKAMRLQQASGGPAQTEKYILSLAKKVKNGIVDRAPTAVVSPHKNPALSSGLSVFFPFRWDKPKQLFTDKKTADWVVAQLLKQNIQIRSIGFDNSGQDKASVDIAYALRVSTAAFNTTSQIQHFQSTLKDVLSRVS